GEGVNVESISEDSSEVAVGEVHASIIWAPANAVGNPNSLGDHINLPLPKPVEPTACTSHHPVHGADPKATATIATTIIENVLGIAPFGINDLLDITVARIEKR